MGISPLLLKYWGYLAALLSAVSFSLNITLAGVAYDHGVNIHALNMVRAGVFWACLWVAIMMQGRSIELPRRAKTISLLLGLLLCLEMYVLLGAIQFIPVALAIVIMYTYPLMIAIYGWFSGRERFSLTQLGAMFAVFLGLFLALAAPVGVISIPGILLATAAALVLGSLLLISEIVLEPHHNNVVMFYMLSATTLLVFLLSATIADLVWPFTTPGWLALVGSTVFYVLATFLLFTAVNLIGPLQTAVIDNTSPVWAVLFGYLLLSQGLSWLQITGVIMVVLGVLCVQWIRYSSRTAG